MSSAEVVTEIEALSRERQNLWLAGGGADPQRVHHIGVRLHELYEELRLARAAEALGGRKRSEIVRQARVESELERLMTR